MQAADSVYKFGERGTDWLKLKPDYFLTDRPAPSPAARIPSAL